MLIYQTHSPFSIFYKPRTKEIHEIQNIILIFIENKDTGDSLSKHTIIAFHF